MPSDDETGTCLADGCGAEAAMGAFCRRHYDRLPGLLKVRLTQTHRAWKQGRDPDGADLPAAYDKCRRAIARLEGRATSRSVRWRRLLRAGPQVVDTLVGMSDVTRLLDAAAAFPPPAGFLPLVYAECD